MSSLSTHVLDTANGRPAAGVSLTLSDAAGQVRFAGVTDEDGRCPGLPKVDTGTYALAFTVADYFRRSGVALPKPPFLDVVTIAFGISEEGHYHVPLLISPYGYSTYRGS